MNLILTNEHLKSNINYFLVQPLSQLNRKVTFAKCYTYKSVNLSLDIGYPGVNICRILNVQIAIGFFRSPLDCLSHYVWPKTLYKFCRFKFFCSTHVQNIVLIWLLFCQYEPSKCDFQCYFIFVQVISSSPRLIVVPKSMCEIDMLYKRLKIGYFLNWFH